jgi:putative Mg2+ transporter-C (MgtC) family protein
MISEFELIIRLLLALLLGALIGLERERGDKPAGLRTHILVSIGSAQFTILSFYAFPGSDPSRITSSIGMAIGIGFYTAAIIVAAISYITLQLAWIEKKLG